MGDPTGDGQGEMSPSLHHECSRRMFGDSRPSLPMERLSREFERFIQTSPERSRLIITAFAANTGVSCSARPGCAGAKGGDDGDRGGGELAVAESEDEDEERELSSEALRASRGVSASSETPSLFTETVRPAIVSPRAACRARGDTGAGAARRN